jgi:aldehyde:ferredoxin oxidoreductase
MKGWTGNVLRIDLSTKEYSRDNTIDYCPKFVGGRGINVKLAFDEIPPQVESLDPDNKLLLGPGVLTGTPVPTASRMTLTTLLPNNMLASSGIGASIGSEIRYAGYDNVILQGKSSEPVYLFINHDRVEFKDAKHLWGKDTFETQRLIREECKDPDIQFLCIGPAGENLVHFSCIVSGLYSAAGHGGLGAVMGSKNLKAIAVRGKQSLRIAHMQEFLDLSLELRNQVQSNAAWKAMIESGGKNNAASYIKGGMAVAGNFEKTLFDADVADDYARRGQEFWDTYKIGRIGCSGCPVNHFYVFDVPGIGIGAPKCQAWSRFAFPIWNNDYKLMFEAGTVCNKYGLDFNSTSNVIAFLMQLYHEGIITQKDTDHIKLERGDPEVIIDLIHKIAAAEGIGEIAAKGVKSASRIFGKEAERLALEVKGREMNLEEYRTLKGGTLTFAVLKDYQDAIPVPEMVWFESKEKARKMAYQLTGDADSADPSSYAGKGRLVHEMEKRTAVIEMLGICKHFLTHLTTSLDIPAKLISLATGNNISEGQLLESAERVSLLERAYNVIRGANRISDTLPERLFDKPLEVGPFAGAVIEKERFQGMVNDYYEVCGYDADGIPLKQKFVDLDLGDEYQTFVKNANKN